MRAADVAEAQAIPVRFLEVILGQLKQGRLVESRRGRAGGYLLARPPVRVTVGDVIRFMEGPIGPVNCVGGAPCPLHGGCVFINLWNRVQEAVSAVYDSTTLQDLVEAEERLKTQYVPTYSI